MAALPLWLAPALAAFAVFAGLLGALVMLHRADRDEALGKQRLVLKRSLEQQFQTDLSEAHREIEALNNQVGNLEQAGARLERRLGQTNEDLVSEREFASALRERGMVLKKIAETFMNDGALEKECHDLIAANMWLFEPDYKIVSAQYCDQHLTTVFQGLFPDWSPQNIDANRFNLQQGWKPDIACLASVDASLQPAFAKNDHPIPLIIELKRPSVTVNFGHIEQTYSYAYTLMLMAGSQLRGKPIECLVIGGTVDPAVNDLHIRIGDTAHGAIRITPISYRRLIRRALHSLEALHPEARGLVDGARRKTPVLEALPEARNNRAAEAA